MSRLTQLHSFLDRFEERLEMDCEQLKRQLIAQVDQQFRAVREKVGELRNRIGGNRVLTTRSVRLEDDPPVETVKLDQWIIKEQDAPLDLSRDVLSTSNGRKRKSSSSTTGTNTNKRQKTGATTDGLKYLCKSPGCGKLFRFETDLSRHERIHLGIKPFSCTWAECRYSAATKGAVVLHVRTQHFKLPRLQKDQAQLNVMDNRNPEDYIRVDNEMLERRLE